MTLSKSFVILSLMIFITIIGCASPKQLTRKEQLLSIEKRARVAQKEYQDISKDKLISAAERVLTLIDPEDVRFSHHENGFIMQRRYSMFLIFGAVWGFDYWHVNVIQNGTMGILDVKAEVRQNVGMFASIPTDPPKKSLAIEESVLSEAEYIIFFKRIDYILGKEPKWITCDDARQYIEKNRYDGKLPFLCGDNYFGIEDCSP